VVLEADRGVLVVRPAAAVNPEEVAALRRHKAEVLRFLTRAPSQQVRLDRAPGRKVLGAEADEPNAVASLRSDVLAAVRDLDQEIRTGRVARTLRLVRGRPLADWLSLDEMARLLRAWCDERATSYED